MADYLREVIPRVYMPVLQELLTEDELATLSLSIRVRAGALGGTTSSNLRPMQ
ncbi:hypothetical protein [Frondihabitans sp. 762G35]|uniref:hypothetical protein n=1 Tax=Frondihabitans sp. 762G35 TaxID=1446794 RepID=UPI0013DC65BC|nr:hypothetical protein [Frondihabitans sp. 762G35]